MLPLLDLRGGELVFASPTTRLAPETFLEGDSLISTYIYSYFTPSHSLEYAYDDNVGGNSVFGGGEKLRASGKLVILAASAGTPRRVLALKSSCTH